MLLSSRITSALVVLTPGEVAGLTVMIVTTSVFFPGHGALLQDAVGIGAASFLRKSYDITDTRKRGRSTGTSVSYLAAGRPACCHSLPIYMMVDNIMFQAHTPWSRLIRPPIAPRMAKFGSSWKSISSLSNLLRDAGPGTASGRYVPPRTPQDTMGHRPGHTGHRTQDTGHHRTPQDTTGHHRTPQDTT